MRMFKLTAKILLLTLGVLLTACTTVQPWERGNLAKPQMALDPYPLQSALRTHNYGSREAAAGGNAAQGGGCGCY
jgi:starvation-inducible outer membrane lipoprotein